MDHPLIIIDPKINNGQATVRNTQYTVQFILEQIIGGIKPDKFLEAHPQLTRESLDAAWRYGADKGIWKNLVRKERGYPCPCCGYLVHDEPSGLHNICPICFWEDDGEQLDFPLHGNGANRVTLLAGQKNYLDFGACEERRKPHVRVPLPDERSAEGWRPIDLTLDGCMEDPVIEDRQQRIIYKMFLRDIRMKYALDLSSRYYWSPTYWRRAINAEMALISDDYYWTPMYWRERFRRKQNPFQQQSPRSYEVSQ